MYKKTSTNNLAKKNTQKTTTYTITAKHGPIGNPGSNGLNGSKIYIDTGIPPTNIGINNDNYIDNNTYNYYKKANNLWNLQFSLLSNVTNEYNNQLIFNHTGIGINLSFSVGCKFVRRGNIIYFFINGFSNSTSSVSSGVLTTGLSNNVIPEQFIPTEIFPNFILSIIDNNQSAFGFMKITESGVINIYNYDNANIDSNFTISPISGVYVA